MPIRTTRKVGVLGKSESRYLTLPRSWCEGSGVLPGADVEIFADGILVVVPPGMQGAAERILAVLHARD